MENKGILPPKTVLEFSKIQVEMLNLFAKKQIDYGPKNIGMGKETVDDEDVRKSLLGLSVRMNDKIQRFLNLTINNQEPNNESLEKAMVMINDIIVEPEIGVIYTGNPQILKKVCPGVFGVIRPVGYCMIGQK